MTEAAKSPKGEEQPAYEDLSEAQQIQHDVAKARQECNSKDFERALSSVIFVLERLTA